MLSFVVQSDISKINSSDICIYNMFDKLCFVFSKFASSSLQFQTDVPVLPMWWPSSPNVVAQFSQRGGPVLPTWWPSSPHVMTQFSPRGGPVLPMWWPSYPHVVAQFSPYGGPVLPAWWPSSPHVVAQFSLHGGPVPKQRFSCV